MAIILWIDPGTTTVGFAVIKLEARKRSVITFGVIHTTPKIPQSQKLLEIYTDLNNLIVKHNISHAAIEKLYFSTNHKTAIDVAQSRWVVLLWFQVHGLPFLEYTPLQIKKAICGNWKAAKSQIWRAVQLLFNLDSIPTPDDAADALSIAYLASLNLSFHTH